MDKDGTRKCISNVAVTLRDLLYNMDKDLTSRYKTNIMVLENNIAVMKKLLDLDKSKEDKKE